MLRYSRPLLTTLSTPIGSVMAWYGAAALDLDVFERFLQQQKIRGTRVAAAPTTLLAAATPIRRRAGLAAAPVPPSPLSHLPAP